MKSFKFQDLMVNVAPAGEKAELFCGFGNTYGCGYGGYSCYHFTCPNITCLNYTCNNFSCRAISCYVYTIPRVQAAVEEAAGLAQPAAAQAGLAANAVVCALPTVHCTLLTGATCPHNTCFGCSFLVTQICQNGPTFVTCRFATCGVTFDPTPTIQVDPEGVSNQLAAVKAQLQQELAAVEAQEKAVADALKPQTAADVEELQGKLRDAIAELDKQKQELQKKDKKK